MEKAVINVEGMSCSHCVKTIKTAVEALDGISSVEVDLGNKAVTVEYESSKVSLDSIKNEIEDQGYDVI